MSLAACGPANTSARISGEVYGTRWSAQWGDPGLDVEEVRARFREVFADVDAATSSWREDSEVAVLARAAPGEPVAISSTLHRILTLALEVAEASDGAFDPTVGPLVRLWGFGPDGRESEPGPEELAATLRRVGWDRLQVGGGGEAHEVVQDPGFPPVELDLSGVAKGDAVDGMARALRELGGTDFLVEIGGEFVAAGERPGGGPWRVGIERPAPSPDAPPTLWRALEVRDAAVATSGNYRNVRGEGESRRSHTIDPRTGRPVAHPVVSATVVGPSCGLADALATALLVEGAEGAERLLGRFPGCRAHLLEVDDAGELRELTFPR